MLPHGIKVLHLPTAVGGNSWGLAQGEKRIGLDAEVLVSGYGRLNYPYDINLSVGTNRRLKRLVREFATFFKIRSKYDVFHFNFGKSLIDMPTIGIHLLDLPFYPRDKRLVFTYNGCDARCKYKTIERVKISACHDDYCYHGVCNDKNSDMIKVKRIERVNNYAYHVFSLNPDLLWVLPDRATFLPYTIAEWYNINNGRYYPGRKIKVIHSPTDRAAKGSEYIIRALEKLKTCYPIETTLVENLPNRVAIEMYKKADLVIDQILTGWYGGFAVECMKMGKPVAVFIREEDLRFIPKEMARDLEGAFININIFNIEEVLSVYFDNISMLVRKSEAALDYVHRWHDPVTVAKTTNAVYQECPRNSGVSDV